MKQFLKSDGIHKALSMLMVVAMLISMLPVTTYAATRGTVSIKMDEETTVVGQWLVFTVSTVANDDLETPVTGAVRFDDSGAIDKMEYYDEAEEKWCALEGSFYPQDSFLLQDTQSKFRVQFKKAGIHEMDVVITAVEGAAELCRASATVTVTGRSVLTTDIGEKTFAVNEATTFAITTMANEDAGAMALGALSFGDAEVVIEYQKSAGGAWEIIAGEFGPAGGFPLTDSAVSNFRVTFKKAGVYTLYAEMKAAETGDTLCFVTETVTVKSRSPISFTQQSIEIKYSDVNAGNNTLVDEVEGAEYTYASDNEKIVKVNQYGILTPVSLGEAEITVTRKENAEYLSASTTYRVKVVPGIQDTPVWNKTIPEAIAWNDPAGYSNTIDGDSVTYRSNNPEVAEVDPATGVLTLKKPGMVTITAAKSGGTLYEDIQVSYTLQVTKAQQAPLQFPQANPDAIYYGDVFETNVAFGGSVEGTVVYESSKDTVATVDAQGKVTAVAQGSVTITATLAGNEFYEPVSASYVLNVYRAEQKSQLTFAKGTENQMIKFGWTDYANVASGGDTAPITYTSSDPTIASVDPVTGKITTHKMGKVTITATAPETEQYQKHELSYELEIGSGKQAVTFEKGTTNIDAITYGDSYGNKASASTAITYSSSDESVAKVDAEGNLQIFAAGTVKIFATAASTEQYDEASDYYVITINKAQQVISFEKGEQVGDDIVVNVTFNDNDNKFSNPATSDVMGKENEDNSDIEIQYSVIEGAELVADGSMNNGAFEIRGAGTVIVTAVFSANARYESNTATYILNIAKDQQTIGFEKEVYEVINGDKSFVTPQATGAAGTGAITYTVKEDASGIIKQIDSATGAVQFTCKEGSAVIVATVAADNNYEQATAEYQLVVKPWTPEEAYYTLTDNKVNGFHIGNVSIIAKDGYLLSYDQTDDVDSWKTVLEDAVTKDGTHTVQFFVKNKETGMITLRQTVEITKDSTPPEVEILQQELGGWDKFLSFITFGMWKAGKTQFTISARDKLSACKVEYILVEVESTDEIMDTEDLNRIGEWLPYEGPIDALENAAFVIYAKATDQAGLYTYAATNGIVADRVPVAEEDIQIDVLTEDYQGFYKGDVELNVQVEDAKPSSGIQSVTYKVFNGQELTQEGTLFRFENEDPTYEELIASWNAGDADRKLVVDARKNNSDYVRVEITVTDNAGNVSTKEMALKICSSEPAVEISFDDTALAETADGISYYAARRTATVVVTGRSSVFNVSDAPVLQISETLGNTAEGLTYEITEWVQQINPENPDEDTHTCQVIFKGNANYQFAVEYVDALGRSAKASADDFVVDADAPTAEVIIDESNSWTTLLTTLTFGLWKNSEVTVKATAADATSPIRSIEYYKSNGGSALSEAELAQVEWTAFEAFTVDKDERFTVYLKVTDRAGNVTYISSDGYIVDPTEILITLTPEATDRSHNDIPLYSGDVAVKIEAAEKAESYSGIKEVKYWVTCDGKVTQPEEILYSFEYQMEDYAPGGENVPSYEDLVSEFSKTVTIDSKLNNSCDVVLYVGVTDNAGNYSEQHVAVDIDITAPTVALTYRGNTANRVVEDRGYYSKPRYATVVITERNGHFEEAQAIAGLQIMAQDFNGDPIVVKDTQLEVDGQGNLVDITQLFDQLKWETTQRDPDTHKLELPYTCDANYTFDMVYVDLAGNTAAEPDVTGQQTPYRFTVDTTLPEATVTALGQSWKKLLEKLTFGLYSNTEVNIAVTEKYDATSPIASIMYHKESEKTAKTYQELMVVTDWTDITEHPQLTVLEEEIRAVYLKITDYAGNVLYLNTDGYIVDKTPAAITLKPEATDRSHDGVALYNKDVQVTIDVTEEAADSYSGIKEVKWWTTCDDEIVVEPQVLYAFGYSMSDYAAEGENVPSYDDLLRHFSETVTIDALSHNSCKVKLYVGVTDNAGNYSEQSVSLDIDVTPPTISLEYDNNNVHRVVGSKGYYSRPRTATIVITERSGHFDAEKALAGIKVQAVDAEGMPISIHGQQLVVDKNGNLTDLLQIFGELKWETVEGNPDAYQLELSYIYDAHYRFGISCQDLAGWENTPVTSESTTPYEFVVDTGLADITMTPDDTAFSHNDVLLYSGDVFVEIDVAEGKGDAYSGLKEIVYWVTCDGKVTQPEEVLYTFDSTADELCHDFKKTVTVLASLNNSCNVQLHVKVTDNVGNEVKEVLPLDIDMTKPTIQVSYSNNSPYKLMNNKGYFPADRIATIVVTERADHFDGDQALAGIKIKAVDFNGKPIVVNGKQLAVDSKGYLTDISQLFGELKWNSQGDQHTLKLPYTHDAIYSFGMDYADAANLSADEVAANEDQATPFAFVIDKEKPTATVAVREYKWSKLLQRLTFGLYSNTEVQVSVAEKDDVISGIASIVYYKTDSVKLKSYDELEKIKDWTDITEDPTLSISAEERFTVYLKITDHAGNYCYIQSDGVIIDQTPAGITLTPEATNLNHNGIPLYNQLDGVDVDISVVEEQGQTYSGLKEVKYWVTCDGEITQQKVLYSFDYDMKDYVAEGQQVPAHADLKHSFSEKVTIDAKLNNSCNVVVYVGVTDNAGNYNEKKMALDIDITPPTIDVSYNNNTAHKVVDGRGYFPAGRTATIVITERPGHFEAVKATAGIKIQALDAKDQPIVVDGTQLEVDNQGNVLDIAKLFGDIKWNTKLGSTPDLATHTLVLSYSQDANYSFAMSYSDMASNPSTGIRTDEAQVTPFAFTVDQERPTATVAVQQHKWSKLLQTLTFGLYGNTEVKVSVEGSNDATSGIASIEYYKTDSVELKTYGALCSITNWTDITAEPSLSIAEEERFAVYLKITDHAGNYRFINSDGYIVDKTPAGITLTLQGTDLSHNDIPLYNGNVDVKVDVVEEKSKTYSGIKEVKYWVTCDGKTTQEEVLYSFGYAMSDYVEEGENVPSYEALLHDFSKTVTIDSQLNNSCDVKLYVMVTDNAGNVSNKSAAVDIDITVPTIDVTYQNNNAYKVLGQKGYFSANRTATIVITERTGHFEAAKATAGIKIKAVDAKGTPIAVNGKRLAVNEQGDLVDITDLFGELKWDTKTGSTPDQATHTLVLPYTHDANYSFSMSYGDLAANAVQSVNTHEAVTPFSFAVDKVAPAAKVTAGDLGSWEKLIEVLTFGLWSQDAVKVSATTSDVTTGIESISYYKTDAVTAKTRKDLDAVTSWSDFSGLTIPADEKFTVYLRVIDDAGNVTYISTNGIIVDETIPTIEHVKPEITITPEPTDGIYQSDVVVAVSVVDAGVGQTNAYAGLKQIRYEVYSLGVKTQDGVLYSFDTENPAHGQLKQSWSKADAIVVDKDLNNSNDVKIVVYAVDNAGNDNQQSCQVMIDKTLPAIEVTYDNNDGDTGFAEGTYFKANRTAKIVITERNFDPAKVTLKITNTDGYIPQMSKWVTVQGAGNGDNTTHTAYVVFDRDGDYTFDIGCVDQAENTNTAVDYAASLAPQSFTVDKTAPVVSVTYDNNDAANGNYYKAARIATVTITEHNFETGRIKLILGATDDGKQSALPVVSGWSSRGDVHTATITYEADSCYTFDLEYTDKAGNVIADIAKQTFFVDKTNPVLTIEKIVDQSANNSSGDIGFVMTATDTNFDVFEPVLTSVVKEGNTFVTKELEIGQMSNIKNGQVFTVTNVDADGIYRITCKVVDKAGNAYSKVMLDKADGTQYEENRTAADTLVTFSVNRDGSAYEVDENTSNLTKQYYVQSVGDDVVIVEINADPLTEYAVTLNGQELKENEDYTVTTEGGNGAWMKYTYKVNKSLFADENEYKVVVSSKDKAANDAFSDVRDATVSFVVDRTAPVVTVSGIAKDGRYQTDKQVVTLIPTDDGGALKTLVVRLVDGQGKAIREIVNLDAEALAAQLEETNGSITFEIPEGLYQNVQIICTDQAVNEDGGTNTYETIIENVSVSSSAVMMFWANKTLRWGSVAGVSAAVVALVVFILLKKKKGK